MQNCINTIKHMPTQLNYFNTIHKRTLALRKQGNTSRLLIIALIIWNIVLTFNAIQPQITTNIPRFTDKQNKQIMIEEFIPPYNLEPIGDNNDNQKV